MEDHTIIYIKKNKGASIWKNISGLAVGLQILYFVLFYLYGFIILKAIPH